MISRRRALLAATACAAAHRASAALPIPPGNTLAFRLVRHGDEIGRHTVTFGHDGDRLVVHIVVDALVTLISIPIVRYSHRMVETWRGETLIGLNGETNKNGEQEWVRAQRGPGGLEVTGSKAGRYIAPEPVRATSYWNRNMLGGPMISLEDGVLLRPKLATGPSEAIPLASGRTVVAEHYNLSGPFNVDLWYDQADIWAGMAVPVKDGSVVHYERL